MYVVEGTETRQLETWLQNDKEKSIAWEITLCCVC
jgi:hypothetical protein